MTTILHRKLRLGKSWLPSKTFIIHFSDADCISRAWFRSKDEEVNGKTVKKYIGMLYPILDRKSRILKPTWQRDL